METEATYSEFVVTRESAITCVWHKHKGREVGKFQGGKKREDFRYSVIRGCRLAWREAGGRVTRGQIFNVIALGNIFYFL